MVTETDYYELLECERAADDGVIKASYRRLAMKWHPDRNPGDAAAEARFKAISEAYDVLKDADKRAAYDRYGHAAFRGGQGGGAGAQGFGDFGDVFDTIFGDFMGRAQGRARNQPQRGADIRYDYQVTLEEAFSGKTAELAYDLAVTCGTCTGTGGKPGSKIAACVTCAGRGQVRMQNGMFIVERTCPTCHGAGRVISDPCDTCHGEGRVEERKAVEVKIPPGVDDGTRIRLAGEGEAGVRGGPAGDLYIFVGLKPHALFRREGTTLFASVPVSFTTAALGGEIAVPALDREPAELKVPAGTQSGRQFRLRGRGMPALNTRGVGDFIVQIEVETPSKLTHRQRELLEEFRAIEQERGDTCPKTHGFWGKLKATWDELTD